MPILMNLVVSANMYSYSTLNSTTAYFTKVTKFTELYL